MGEFKADGGAAIAIAELLFDGEEKVVHFFLVDVELAIAGDAGGPSPENLQAGKDVVDEVTDELGEEDKFMWGGAGLRKGNEAGNAAGNLDEGVAGGFGVAGLGVEDDEVD